MVDDELWDLISRIPSGRCTTYGTLGRALLHPTSGRVVGRRMGFCPSDVPWWRVVNRLGALPIHKVDPMLAADQRQRLLDEGVPFVGDQVDLKTCFWEPE